MKKNNLVTLIIILMIILCFCGFTGYILYDKLNSKDDIVENNKNEEVDNNNEIDNNSKYITKVDESKDWIYNAPYDYNNIKTYSYEVNGITYNPEGIIVPYININSLDATNVNKKIKEIFDDQIKYYNKLVEEKFEERLITYYSKHINDDILSTLITTPVSLSVPFQNYYAYNFDLITGKSLSYEDLYMKVGFTKDNIDELVKKSLTNKMKEVLRDVKEVNDGSDGAYYPNGTNFDTYNDESFDNYKKSVSNNSIKSFLASDGKLNIVVTLSVPAGKGSYDTIIEINK